MGKKRAPIDKLRYAKKFADELLTERKLILPHDKSAFARLFSEKDSPVLPGVPAYLPHRHTIETTRRVLFDLALIWKEKTKSNSKAQEDVSEFFRFAIKSLEEENVKVKAKMFQSVVKQEYDLKLFHQKSVVTGIAKFLVDSFAVSVVEKTNSSVSEYMEWFLRWSDSLLKQWLPRQNGSTNSTQQSNKSFIQKKET